MPDRPWMKWYPADWRGDPKLRMCSFAARGFWADLCALMHESEPYGHLLINGKIPSEKQLANILGGTPHEIRKLTRELEAADVFSRTDQGVIYSRRMVRDHQKRVEGKAWGKAGGNPQLTKTDKAGDKEGVNPPVKASRARHPEARGQSHSRRAAEAASPEADLYRRGRELLGKDGGAIVTKLKTAKGGSIAQARAVLEQASEKHDPKEYVMAAIKKQGGQQRSLSDEFI